MHCHIVCWNPIQSFLLRSLALWNLQKAFFLRLPKHWLVAVAAACCCCCDIRIHIVILPTPLIFIFYTEKICLHPVEIIGDIVNQNEELTWYFLDGRTYYLTCPPGFDVPAEGTLWECVDGMWQSGSDCVGNFAIKINQSNPDFIEVGCTPTHTHSTPITRIHWYVNQIWLNNWQFRFFS